MSEAQKVAVTEAAQRYGVRPETVQSLYGGVGQQALSFFESHGLSKAAAAGIVGNMQQESSLNPNAPGGGLIQGQGGRTSSGTAYQQFEGVLRELSGPERSTLQALKGAKTPEQAARIFSERFERPGIPMLANRERYAREAFGAAEPASKPSGGPQVFPVAQPSSFNAAAFQKAQRAALVGKLIASSGETKGNPLLASGLASTKAPLRSEYMRPAKPASARPNLGISRETSVPSAPNARGLPSLPVAPEPKGIAGEAPALGHSAPPPTHFSELNVQKEALERFYHKTLSPKEDRELASLVAKHETEGTVVAEHHTSSGRHPIVKVTTGPKRGQTVYVPHHSDTPLGGQLKAQVP